MPISKEERERFERQVRALREIETDDPGTPEFQRQVIEYINPHRVEIGLEPYPLDDEEEEPGELEFFRRARALGMARIRRDRT